MLVLTRKPGEALKIGEDVSVTILDIREGQVRLGIQAPKGIRIYRQEVYERIIRDNLAASSISLEEFGKIKEAVKSEDNI